MKFLKEFVLFGLINATFFIVGYQWGRSHAPNYDVIDLIQPAPLQPLQPLNPDKFIRI